LAVAGFAAFYIFIHHAFVAGVIVLIPDYIVYSNNRGLHRHFSLFTTLRLATDMEASSVSPSHICARLMMVPTLRQPVLATLGHAFILDVFPSLASLAQRLVFIGFDNVFIGINYFSMSALTPEVCLVLAKLGPHLVLGGSDCIISGINIPLR
jgi:hypothetical protein